MRLKLQEIIDNEDKHRPFSDDELVKELDEDGPERGVCRTVTSTAEFEDFVRRDDVRTGRKLYFSSQ